MSAHRLREIREIGSEEALELAKQEEGPLENDLFGLNINERRWVAYYSYLKEKGYELRPRFQPGWVRSWKGTKIFPDDCEDSWSRVSKLTLDAVRLSDGQQVMIKKLLPASTVPGGNGHNELDIVQFLSSEPLVSDPRNHSMPYIDSFPIPDVQDGLFLVTPLFVAWNNPELGTIGEVIEFIRQILEGISFLHDNRVAHRDCTPPNIMMDWRPLINEPFHPIRNACSLDGKRLLEIGNRTNNPVRYYFIDFGLSTRFSPEQNPTLVTGSDGREQGVPELSDKVPYDPFKVDIFILGAFIDRDIVQRFHGLEYLRPLLSHMKNQDPTKRATAAEAVRTYADIVTRFPPRTRQWSLVSRQSGFITTALFTLYGWVNHSIFAVQRILRLGRKD